MNKISENQERPIDALIVRCPQFPATHACICDFRQPISNSLAYLYPVTMDSLYAIYSSSLKK